jgi:DNA polymerase-2
LARRFQRDLLDLAFHDAPHESIENHVADTLARLRSGRLDAELVYQKTLRKPIADYVKTQPPHVQAAALLPRGCAPGDVVRYVITLRGPRPVERIDAPLDYAHYVAKQLLPIARTLFPLVEVDDALFGSGQMALF